MVLLEWINQLHSSPSVNVIHCMPRFLSKFLTVIESQESEQMNDLGRKATDLLAHFLEDLKDGGSRTILLDREIIIKLLEFLSKCDESKRITLYTSLTWFNYFLDFFRQDFLAVLQQSP